MRKQDLFGSSAQLVPPFSFALTAYRARRDYMASEVARRLMARQDLDALIGPANRLMMEDSIRNHARFMESLFSAYDHRMFVETLLWIYRAFRTHGFTMAYWSLHLATWREVLKESLPSEAFEAIRPFYDWLASNQDALGALTAPVAAIPSAHATSTVH